MPASLPASPLMSSASRDGDRYKGSARCKEVLLDVGQSMEIQLVRKKDSTETVMERKNSSRCVSERLREAARQRTRRSKAKHWDAQKGSRWTEQCAIAFSSLSPQVRVVRFVLIGVVQSRPQYKSQFLQAQTSETGLTFFRLNTV